MRHATIAVVLGAVLLAAAGCGGSRHVGAAARVSLHLNRPPTREAVLRLARHVPCLNNHERPAGPAAVRRFHAVTAVSCIDGTRIYPGHGQWHVRIRRVAGSSIAGLQRYFEQPSVAKHPKNLACTLNLVGIVVPVFVDARGHSLVPMTPVDACNKPLGYPEYGKGSTRVRWRVVSVHKVRLEVSAAALAAHCAMGVKDLPAGGIGPLSPSSGGSLFRSTPKTVRACIYRTAPNDFEVGNFVRGFTIDAARTRRLLGALTGAAPGGSCPNVRTFAVISADRERWAEVELGGCWRVGRTYPYYGLGGSDAAVVHSILGSG